MRENNSHKCPANGCEEMVPYYLLMCKVHWRQVPRRLQVRVVQEWRKGGASGHVYLLVRAAAITAVNGEQS